MDAFLKKLMFEAASEMARLCIETEEAYKIGDMPLYRRKHTALGHAIVVTDRILQIVAIWNTAKAR